LRTTVGCHTSRPRSGTVQPCGPGRPKSSQAASRGVFTVLVV
jgi:hypothetical protein